MRDRADKLGEAHGWRDYERAIIHFQSRRGGSSEKKRLQSAHSEAPSGELRVAQQVTEFPKLATPDDVVSERIVFEVGGDRFAMKWTAKIEQLPQAGLSGEREAIIPNRLSCW